MAFAAPLDLGDWLDETIAADDARATLLLDLVTGLIAAEIGFGDGWAAALDPVPVVVKGVCLAAAARAWSNPESLRSLQEQLGSFQEARTYTIAGLALTDAERDVVQNALGESGTAAARSESWMTDLYDADLIPDPISGWIE
jgi:hypothetical protein